MKKARLLIVLVMLISLAAMLAGCSFIFGDGTNNNGGIGGNQDDNSVYYLRFVGDDIDLNPIELPRGGGKITLPADPERFGYTFGGWYMEQSYKTTLGEYLASHSISGDIIAYAKWVPVGNTVRITSNNGEAGKITVDGGDRMVEHSNTYDFDDNISLEAVTTDDHYDFLGWFVDDKRVTTESSYTYTVANKPVVEIEARWRGVARTAVFHYNYSGADPETYNYDYYYGDSFSYCPDASLRDDYGFVGWYDNSECADGTACTDRSGEFLTLKSEEAVVEFYAKWLDWNTLEPSAVICQSLSATEAVVTGYNGLYLDGDVLYIPYTWHGKAVTKIQASSFAGLTQSKIVIPSTITVIESGAFTGTSAAKYFDNSCGAKMSNGLLNDIVGDIYVHVSNDISELNTINSGKITGRYVEANGIFADNKIDNRAEFEAMFSYLWLYTVSDVTLNFKGCEGVTASNYVYSVIGERMANGENNNPDAWVEDLTLRLALKTNTESGYGITHSTNESAWTMKFNFNKKTEHTVASESTTRSLQTQATASQAFVNEGAAHDFKIDARPSYVVFTSEQLVYAVEHGYKPYFPVSGSSAESCYNRARTILGNIVKAEYNDYQKLTAIHDYIATNVIYDSDLLALSAVNKAELLSGYRGFNLEGVFIDGRAVCDGITKAFMLMSRIEGIEVIRVSGRKGETGHAWNKVKIGDDWYAVDVTGDDPIIGMQNDVSIEALRHDMFMVPDSALVGYTEDTFSSAPAATERYNYYANTNYKGYVLEVNNSVTLKAMLNAMIAEADADTSDTTYFTMDIKWTGLVEPNPQISGLFTSHTDEYYTYIYVKNK